MGAGDVAGLVVKPAVSGTMRARKANSTHLAKKQRAAYVGVAILMTVLSKALNELVDRHLGDQ
jgi:hypothetical protein